MSGFLEPFRKRNLATPIRAGKTPAPQEQEIEAAVLFPAEISAYLARSQCPVDRAWNIFLQLTEIQILSPERRR